MNRYFKFLYVLLIAAFAAAGCSRSVALYDGPEYVMFSDTTGIYPVTEDCTPYMVTVAATTVSDRDRTFGIVVDDVKSNAIEGVNFTLPEYNVTIKAGEMKAEFPVVADYDSFKSTDSIGVVLRLVADDRLMWKNTETAISFFKACPQSVSDFLEDGGNFIFYASFPFSQDGSLVKKLRKAKADPYDPNVLVFEDLYDQNYDIRIRLVTGDYLNPKVEIPQQEAFFASDVGRVCIKTSPAFTSYYNSCQRFMMYYVDAFVEGGYSFGPAVYLLEWISQNEADYYELNGFPSIF